MSLSHSICFSLPFWPSAAHTHPNIVTSAMGAAFKCDNYARWNVIMLLWECWSRKRRELYIRWIKVSLGTLLRFTFVARRRLVQFLWFLFHAVVFRRNESTRSSSARPRRRGNWVGRPPPQHRIESVAQQVTHKSKSAERGMQICNERNLAARILSWKVTMARCLSFAMAN